MVVILLTDQLYSNNNNKGQLLVSRHHQLAYRRRQPEPNKTLPQSGSSTSCGCGRPLCGSGGEAGGLGSERSRNQIPEGVRDVRKKGGYSCWRRPFLSSVVFPCCFLLKNKERRPVEQLWSHAALLLLDLIDASSHRTESRDVLAARRLRFSCFISLT